MREADIEEENAEVDPGAVPKREEAAVDAILEAVSEIEGRHATGGPKTFDSLKGHRRSVAYPGLYSVSVTMTPAYLKEEKWKKRHYRLCCTYQKYQINKESTSR
ncbi:hypothetical protein NDU88_000577 [Pleurodeles waltl]|uniref:Uncharacterized protein n=1 Tax=Pleurodeles waltl TaxID=8319 RepID=A0AAV7LA71_PLEWA|nr:hypothetical protein NDU88_000577 [Pleurodeles waltl]